MPDEDQPALGCSKCRYSQRGCKRCKHPAFNSRKRGNLTSCSKGRAPKRQSRHHGQPISKASHDQTKQSGTKTGKAPGTVAVCSFSVHLFARYSAHVLHQVQQDLLAELQHCHPKLALLGVSSTSYVFPLQRPPLTPSRLQIRSWQCQQISHSHCLCLRVSQKHHHPIAPQR